MLNNNYTDKEDVLKSKSKLQTAEFVDRVCNLTEEQQNMLNDSRMQN